MYKKIFFFAVIIVSLFINSKLFARDKEITKEEAIAIASDRVKQDGEPLEGVDIIYDDGNKLWEQQINKIIVLDRVANFEILKKGFLKQYIAIYFNFKPSHRDIWIFIDKNTGEILDIYKM